MIKNFRKQWILWLFILLVLTLGFGFPDVRVTFSGGFAWIPIVGIYFIAVIMIVIGILGGEVSYSSKGLIPVLREWWKRRNGDET